VEIVEVKKRGRTEKGKRQLLETGAGGRKHSTTVIL